MIHEMRQISLDYIYNELYEGKDNIGTIVEDLESWYLKFRNKYPGKLFPFLIEDIGKIEKLYTVVPDPEENDTVNLIVSDIKEEHKQLLPFVKPSGAQSSPVGPVIKRSYNTQENKAGPTAKIIKTAYTDWRKIAASNIEASSYYREILNILSRKKINVLNKEFIEWEGKYGSQLECLINIIGRQKATVFLAVKDLKNRYPGEVKEYIGYLLDKLTEIKYETTAVKGITGKTCTLCNTINITVYPNGVKGAGINIGNIDREGAFNNLSLENAWKNFAVCSACADLLYIYKNHTLKMSFITKKRPFQARVAGENALIVPYLFGNTIKRQKLIKKIKQMINNAERGVNTVERRLWGLLKNEEAILNINIYWLTIGQNIEKLNGAITDVLPSRLRELSKINIESLTWENPVFPKVKIEGRFEADLSLNALGDIFKRPGGKKVKNYNESRELSKLRKTIAASIYHHTQIDANRFWAEVMKTAELYLMEAISRKETYGLLNEGITKKGEHYLTFAGWIRHLAWWLYYFRKMEVLKMNEKAYESTSKLLSPYFSNKSGIDTIEKAFAFILGILFGRLIKIQAARGINVSANALTWLKRLTLKGSDLPELYIKIREKLLAYDAEGNEKVRELLHELGILGIKLGDKIELNSIFTNYFLLLGQSLSNEIIPSRKKEESKNE